MPASDAAPFAVGQADSNDNYRNKKLFNISLAYLEHTLDDRSGVEDGCSWEMSCVAEGSIALVLLTNNFR
jgi:hypothetical protein